MGRYILKQPNGLYCVWSSIVDSPIIWNATKEDLYKTDYLSITLPLVYGRDLKDKVDYAISLGYEFEGKSKPSFVHEIGPDKFKKFLKDIGSKYTIDDFYVQGYTKMEEIE